MDVFIQQAFAHVDFVGPAVRAGHFDLFGPTGEIISKGADWEKTIEPYMKITMSMWPLPEQRPMRHSALPERPGRSSSSKSKKSTSSGGMLGFLAGANPKNPSSSGKGVLYCLSRYLN